VKCVHRGPHAQIIVGAALATVKVGIREFRDNLASYLLQSETPVAITRHGETVGFYLPVRRRRTEAEKEAFTEAAARVDKMMAELGITEEDIAKDLEEIHRDKHRQRNSK